MNIKLGYYPDGRKKALTMSYDDGHIYDRRLVELFNQYGIKGTFHLNSGFFGREQILDSAEIGELFKGHEVSAHSLTHPALSLTPGELLTAEILEDRKNLESLVGYPVRGMSYPFGDFNDAILKALPALGIEYSRTVLSHGRFQLPGDFLQWHPTCHHGDNLMARLEAFRHTSEWQQMPLLYVWGHSYEFHRNNNWELIEEFCRAASFLDDVWYATNIEIADYVTALRRLKFSVDRTMIFNPSAIQLWVGIDGEAVAIRPGETIKV